MTHTTLSVAELARTCREETAKFLRGEARDDAFCFELFARAVGHRDPDAWEAIMAQYRGIVLAYVNQHPSVPRGVETDDFWVSRAFQRLWMAVGAERFDQFPDLPSVLRYLKMCVHSIIMDELRARRGGQVRPWDEVPPTTAAPENAERAAVGELAAAQLWEAVERELQDEAERQVTYLSLLRDLKPAEVLARHPNLFASVGDVYRVKRNVLERLRRSPTVRAFLD